MIHFLIFGEKQILPPFISNIASELLQLSEININFLKK